jgi:Flp pilus assembly protein TadG
VRHRRSRAAEQGQTLVLTTLMMMGLLGAAGLVIDLGGLYQARRSVQAAADAAALAGASQLPAGWSYAHNAAAANYAKNGKAADSVAYQNVTDGSANDSILITATRTSPTYFIKLFGFSSANITVSARATVKSITSVISTGQVMPWGVMQDSWTLGSQYSIYTDNSSPNNGALSLDVHNQNNPNCTGTSGASDYRNTIAGSLVACQIRIGDLEPVKTGQNTGPTAQGINQRITTWEPVSAIVQFTANGQAEILKPQSPQLVLLPVVLNANGSKLWPQGGGNVRVVGFAYFVLEEPGYTNGGKTVLGIFAGLQGPPNTTWETGAWNPQTGTASTIQLTA